ncbi:PilZ domain-containing protein [Alkalimarinus sediminis]|uniref:PilZ domain-containing protein n=1 Tax=Alkalimarinus sediminis TaxID=1632866 RepID=A0A9E8HEW0_9ALTE|nr:PilZ domain-containing protein [Alkalimarinus sediminis]UZW73363.1 PilZ domain-containing protein [Alkalimarinus sediminis]
MKDGISNYRQDRRIKERHSAPCLQVTIRPSGFLKWLRSTVDVKCIDINRYGMAVESPCRFRPKEKIALDFKGKYITESNISAVVTSCEKYAGKYRLGITFSYFTCNRQYSRKIDNALSRIERLYNERYGVERKAG